MHMQLLAWINVLTFRISEGRWISQHTHGFDGEQNNLNKKAKMKVQNFIWGFLIGIEANTTLKRNCIHFQFVLKLKQ